MPDSDVTYAITLDRRIRCWRRDSLKPSVRFASGSHPRSHNRDSHMPERRCVAGICKNRRLWVAGMSMLFRWTQEPVFPRASRGIAGERLVNLRLTDARYLLKADEPPQQLGLPRDRSSADRVDALPDGTGRFPVPPARKKSH